MPGGTGNVMSEDNDILCKLDVLGRGYALPGLHIVQCTNGLTREKVATDPAAGWFGAWTMV